MATFIVERYVPGITCEEAQRVVAREAELAQRMAREGRAIHVLHSTLVEGDETVMSVVEAASRDDVLELGERSGVPADRVVPAVDMPSSPGASAIEDGP